MNQSISFDMHRNIFEKYTLNRGETALFWYQKIWHLVEEDLPSLPSSISTSQTTVDTIKIHAYLYGVIDLFSQFCNLAFNEAWHLNFNSDTLTIDSKQYADYLNLRMDDANSDAITALDKHSLIMQTLDLYRPELYHLIARHYSPVNLLTQLMIATDNNRAHKPHSPQEYDQFIDANFNAIANDLQYLKLYEWLRDQFPAIPLTSPINKALPKSEEEPFLLIERTLRHKKQLSKIDALTLSADIAKLPLDEALPSIQQLILIEIIAEGLIEVSTRFVPDPQQSNIDNNDRFVEQFKTALHHQLIRSTHLADYQRHALLEDAVQLINRYRQKEKHLAWVSHTIF